MANFCRYCGKPLVNGACDCEKARSQSMNFQQEAPKREEPRREAPRREAAPKQSSIDFHGILDSCKNVLSRPKDAASQMVGKMPVAESLMVCLMEALICGIMSGFLVNRMMTSIAGSYGSYSTTAVSAMNATTGNAFSFANVFIFTAIVTLIMDLALAIGVFGGTKILTGSQASFGDMFSVVAMKSVVNALCSVVGGLLLCVAPMLGVIVFVLCFMWGFFVLMQGIEAIDGMNQNRVVYIALIAYVVYLVAVAFMLNYQYNSVRGSIMNNTSNLFQNLF